jgi:hypothetical protein
MKALTLALLLFICPNLHAATVVAEPFPPAAFTSLYIERFDKGTSMVIQTSGDAVIYKVTVGNDVRENVIVHPSGDDWFQFIKALNDAKVYKWTSRYYYPGQGETWIIDATMSDRKFTSGGTNDYPLSGDEAKPQANPLSGPSVPFQLFWQAALKLVGKEPPSRPATK